MYYRLDIFLHPIRSEPYYHSSSFPSSDIGIYPLILSDNYIILHYHCRTLYQVCFYSIEYGEPLNLQFTTNMTRTPFIFMLNVKHCSCTGNISWIYSLILLKQSHNINCTTLCFITYSYNTGRVVPCSFRSVLCYSSPSISCNFGIYSIILS